LAPPVHVGGISKFTLEKGEKIKVSGFGNFVVRDKLARTGRNPPTGPSCLPIERLDPDVDETGIGWGRDSRIAQNTFPEDTPMAPQAPYGFGAW
jgi:hypothetical protein